ncbi:ABC transporter permease [Nocardiopsis alkaliphila]|uniref:ABC transporter permease n=1 Tax=Nocardiopsis alkaliphila TaxID=225762 RepID=UPI0003622EFD
MADTHRRIVPGDEPGEGDGGARLAVTKLLRPFLDYRRLAWLWVRAAAQYPLSLALMSLAVTTGVLTQVGAVVIVFGHAGTLAGFTVYEGLLVFALASSAFGIADMFAGSVERLGHHVRTGSFDAMLIRPVSPLVQVAADEFSPRRLGKVVPALVVLGIALVNVDVEWSYLKMALLALTMLSGVLICSAIWVISACVQFFVAGAREAANSLTYGGQALTEYPIAIYGEEIVRSVTYVVPLAFVSWQPALLVLDRPDPLGMPEYLRHTGPAVAVLLCACAALVWRTGLRHYRSTGS